MPNPANPIQEIMALHGMRRFAEMEARARHALKIASNSAVLHELLGIALCAQQRFEEALRPLQRAVSRQPDDAQFHENLALCQRHLKHYEAAEESLRRALRLRPNSVESLNALASVLRSLRRLDEADTVLRQALALAPRHPITLCIRGNVFCDLGSYAEAQACYREAIAAAPSSPAAYAQLGNVLMNTGQRPAALAAIDAALKIVGAMGAAADPVEANDIREIAANVLAGSAQYVAAARLYRQIFQSRKSLPGELAAYSTLRQVCDWQATGEIEKQFRGRKLSRLEYGDVSPFNFLSMPGITAEQQLDAASRYSNRVEWQAGLALERPPPPPRPAPPARDRLRVGYLSRDLGDHAIGHLTVRVFENHDRDRFEIIAYDYSPPTQDAFRRRITGAFEHVVPLHALADRAAAQRIAADSCDVVVDVTGWTHGTRSQILRFRPGPIQVQWLGYPGTLGAPWCDYIVADKVLIGPGEERFYSEKIVRLPFTYQPNDDRRTIGEPGTRADHGLPAEPTVFCSFNQAYKITAEVFDVWMRLLRQAERSVLWLLAFAPEVRETLGREAECRGVSRQRLAFAPFVSNEQHLARLPHADLALDCAPYGSHTTASDTLWIGVPMIALAGDTFASRVSASILSAAGLSDLVAASPAAYHDLALRYAADRALLNRLRTRVAECRSSPLFDSKLFVRGLESAYTTIIERNRMGLPPDHISIEPEAGC
jgi:protein O-GlcNAc transferase